MSFGLHWWSVNIGSDNGLVPLIHLPLDKMAVISQMIFSDAFSWMKSLVFWLKFHWSLFLSVQLTTPGIGLDNGLAPNRRQAIIWSNADMIHWRIYAALQGCELNGAGSRLCNGNRQNKISPPLAIYIKLCEWKSFILNQRHKFCYVSENPWFWTNAMRFWRYSQLFFNGTWKEILTHQFMAKTKWPTFCNYIFKLIFF